MEADYSNIDGLALFQTGQLIQLKRIQLQKLCKSCGLNAGGKNVEMVDRLREYYAASKEDALDDKENVQPLLPIEQPIKCIESPMSAEEGGEMVKTTEKVVTPPIQPPSEPHTLGGPALENSLPIQGSPMRARSKSVADRVKEEMENRLNQDHNSSKDSSSVLMRSKSVYFHVGHSDKMIERQHQSSKWDLIHRQQFNKMDSIANHYSTKRNSSAAVLKADQSKRKPMEGTSSKIALAVKRSKNAPEAASTDAENNPKLCNPSVTAEPRTPRSDKQSSLLQRIVAQLSGSKKKEHASDKKSSLREKPLKEQSKFLNRLQSVVRSNTKPVESAAVTGNTKPPAKKPFDLKASLAKPLNYKPYTGKLKPLDQPKRLVSSQTDGNL